MLNYHSFGDISKHPSLLIVHGLFGSARNWRAIARNLSADRRVHVVDMRNHGDSFWDDSHNYHDMANDLADIAEHIDEKLDVMGHSMGGKAAMILALTRPELVNRLMVIDIAPKPYQHEQNSNIDIMQSLDLDSFTRRSEADAILAQAVDDPNLRAFFLQSVVIAEDGNRWQLNLDALRENMDHIIGFPPVSGEFTGESMFLRGGASDYFNDDDLVRTLQLFPNATLTTIADVGHWVQAEAPRKFLAEVKKFLV